MPPSTAGHSPSVTVVVLNYINGMSLLLPCLRHVLGQRGLPPGGLDLWVVHNPTDLQDKDDDDWATVREELKTDEFRRVRVIENEANVGFAGGHNVAFREVETEFVAIVNSDARPGPTWLAELLAVFDAEANQRLGAATSKLVFLPRYLPVKLSTAGFVPAELDPGAPDTRRLGVRVHEIRVDGRDVTGGVFWGEFGDKEEGAGTEQFRWTRPAGTMLVPVDPEGTWSRTQRALRLTMRLGAEAIKPVELSWPGGTAEVKTDDQPAHVQPAEVNVEVPPGAGLIDLLNNAGSMVDANGHGTDLGFRKADQGQFDKARDVFAFCGAAVCFRTAALRDTGYFDDDFFMYYEDTDLSWRMWALGWRVRYVPASVVRHKHSSTLEEGSERRQFYVDRNRLLTLTKNARAWLAVRQVLGYTVGAALLILSAFLHVGPGHRPPPDRLPPRPRMRWRVVTCYLRLLPRMLRRRRDLARRTVVRRRHLRHWVVPWPGPGH
jgi:GT2 family glycosyltransferase